MLSYRLAVPCAFAVVFLAGCSGAQDADRSKNTAQGEARVFSEEERNAARVLSMSNRNMVPQTASAYDQAVICSSAIEALADRLRQSDALTGEQLQIIDQAKAVYDRRIRTLAEEEANTAGDASGGNMPRPEIDAPAGGQALHAIGCIQNLAEAI